MSFDFTPSETAAAKVAADFAYLPEHARKIVAGYLTLLEEIDARYAAMTEDQGDVDHITATQMIARRHSPAELAMRRREWATEREFVVRQLASLLAIYPKPMVVKFHLP